MNPTAPESRIRGTVIRARTVYVPVHVRLSPTLIVNPVVWNPAVTASQSRSASSPELPPIEHRKPE